MPIRIINYTCNSFTTPIISPGFTPGGTVTCIGAGCACCVELFYRQSLPDKAYGCFWRINNNPQLHVLGLRLRLVLALSFPFQEIQRQVPGVLDLFGRVYVKIWRGYGGGGGGGAGGSS